MKFITLMTDFGVRDGYTGVMKGVIYRIISDVQIADISHSIHPQDVLEGSLVWNRSVFFYPAGTVHVGVVDPGVGTQRRPIAARLGNHFFVCPDNGLITLPLEIAEQKGEPVEIVHLNQAEYWLPQVSNVFHGRDIFAPTAAHLASGVPLHKLGSPISDPVRLDLPKPVPTKGGWRGEITNVDHFGNLGTNITERHLQAIKNIHVRAADKEISGLVKTFGDRAPGELVALIDSDGSLAISIVQGSAAKEIGLKVGDQVDVIEGS